MRRLATPFVLATPLTMSLVLVAELLTPTPDEPFAARWARTAAAHPIRTWLALALLAAAFLGPKKGSSEPRSTELASRAS